MADQLPRLLRPADIPDAYGFTQRQIRRWLSEGRLRRVKPSGPTGPVYLRRDDLDALIEAATIPAGQRTKAKPPVAKKKRRRA